MRENMKIETEGNFYFYKNEMLESELESTKSGAKKGRKSAIIPPTPCIFCSVSDMERRAHIDYKNILKQNEQLEKCGAFVNRRKRGMCMIKEVRYLFSSIGIFCNLYGKYQDFKDSKIQETKELRIIDSMV